MYIHNADTIEKDKLKALWFFLFNEFKAILFIPTSDIKKEMLTNLSQYRFKRFKFSLSVTCIEMRFS